MTIFLDFFGGGGPIQYIDSVITNEEFASVPAHEAGDMIIVIARAFGPSDAPPAVFSGFTSIVSTDPDFGFAARSQWAIDTDNTINELTNSAPSTLHIIILRNAASIGASNTENPNTVSATLNMPALTLTETDGTSAVIAAGLTNQGNSLSVPTGMTEMENNNTNAFGGGAFSSFYVLEATSFTGLTSTASGGITGFWHAHSFEVLAV